MFNKNQQFFVPNKVYLLKYWRQGVISCLLFFARLLHKFKNLTKNKKHLKNRSDTNSNLRLGLFEEKKHLMLWGFQLEKLWKCIYVVDDKFWCFHWEIGPVIGRTPLSAILYLLGVEGLFLFRYKTLVALFLEESG